MTTLRPSSQGVSTDLFSVRPASRRDSSATREGSPIVRACVTTASVAAADILAELRSRLVRDPSDHHCPDFLACLCRKPDWICGSTFGRGECWSRSWDGKAEG